MAYVIESSDIVILFDKDSACLSNQNFVILGGRLGEKVTVSFLKILYNVTASFHSRVLLPRHTAGRALTSD